MKPLVIASIIVAAGTLAGGDWRVVLLGCGAGAAVALMLAERPLLDWLWPHGDEFTAK